MPETPFGHTDPAGSRNAANLLDPAVQITPDPDDPDGFVAGKGPGGPEIRLTPAEAYLAEQMRRPYSEVVLVAKCNARFAEHLTVRDLHTLTAHLAEAGMMAGPPADPARSGTGQDRSDAASAGASAAASAGTGSRTNAGTVSGSGPGPESGTGPGPGSGEDPRRFRNHWSLCRPRPVLDFLLPAVAWMRFFKILVPVAVILAVVGFVNNLDLFFADISAIKTRVSYFGRVVFTLFTISLITQVYRGLTARHFRFDTPSFGLMLVFGLLPRFNMRVTVPDDADRHARLWALGAPVYIRFIVFPLGIMAWLTFRDQGTALSQISAGLAMVSMISFLFVANPLLGGAGYRFLSEWSGVENLRQKAFARLKSFFSRRPAVVMQYMDRSPAVLVYGLMSVLFTLALVGFISMTAARWLELNYRGLGVAVFLLVLVYLFFRFVYEKLVIRRRRRRAEALVESTGSGPGTPGGAGGLSGRSVSSGPGPRTPGFFRRLLKVRYLVLLVLAGVCFLPYLYESGGDAEVFPMTSAAVYAKYPDLVDTIYFDGGEILEKGTVIAEMVNDRQEYDVAQTREEIRRKQAELEVLLTTPSAEEIALAEEEVKTAQVMLQYSRQRFDRMDKLYEKEVVSFVEYEDALRQLELDGQLLAAAKARLADLRTRVNKYEIEAARIGIDLLNVRLAYHEQVLDRTRLKMPISGRIITMNLKNLQDTYLDDGVMFAEVEDMSRARVEIRVPESDVTEIGVGHPVRLRLHAFPGREFIGRVDRIYPAAVVDAVGRYVICETVMDNDQELFRSGMTGFAKIEGTQMFVIQAFTRALVRFVKVEAWSWLP
jgi:putative peptide zinc metalloprotease protein